MHRISAMAFSMARAILRCQFTLLQKSLAKTKNDRKSSGSKNQGPLNGGVSNGGFPDLDLSFPFCPFWDFPSFSGIFPICSGMVRGFSRFVPFLFLGLLRAPTRNSPERVRDTIWTFPEKVGNPPVWKPPRFISSSKKAYKLRGPDLLESYQFYTTPGKSKPPPNSETRKVCLRLCLQRSDAFWEFSCRNFPTKSGNSEIPSQKTQEHKFRKWFSGFPSRTFRVSESDFPKLRGFRAVRVRVDLNRSGPLNT